jgi:5-methylcytosine-specific restriction protein A
MNFPNLETSSRRREFDSYDFGLQCQSVIAWLFHGQTHREIDEKVLGLDSSISKGWQSMGILHFLGLKGDSKGIFSGFSIDKAVSEIEDNPGPLDSLLPFLVQSRPPMNIADFHANEDSKVKASLAMNREERLKRIRQSKGTPIRTSTTSFAYSRSADIVAEALHRADGICEHCGKDAPFIRSSDNTPYLEVHHVEPLAKDGPDSLENVLALCPNCHKQLHFGQVG